MASKTISLKVLLEAVGIKPTTEQLEALNKQLGVTEQKMKQTAKAANKTKRANEGVGKSSLNSTKSFAKQAQGLGGLVQAYATIAANVFALSSAFLVLRRAADLSSMVKSAEDFSNRFGVSVTRITRLMQEASGGALDFAEALPSINKAVSAGIGIKQMQQLTEAATKASQTFGGSTTEALSRFISASQRGRVEIIQTLGVVIKTEQAYADYAASIGKTALELTAFDRQQAILNATIEESNRVFAGVKIDPNPFTQFASTMVDLKDTILTTITDGITPFINLINKSLPAALLIMAALLKSIVGRIFPVFTTAVAAATKAGLESSRAVTAAQVASNRKRVKFLLESEQQLSGLTKSQLTKRLKTVTAANSSQLIEAKAFRGRLYNINGKANKAAFIQLKSWIGRVVALRAKGTVMKGSEFLTDQAAMNLKNLTAATAASTGVFKSASTAQAGYAQSMTVTSSRFKELTATIVNGTRRIRTSMLSIGSSFKSGFAGVFAATQAGGAGFGKALNDTGRAWKIFGRDIRKGGKGISKTFLNISKVGGRSLGLLAGGFAAAAGAIFNIIFFIGLAKVAFSAINKRLNTSSYQLKELGKVFEEFKSSLKEITERSNNYVTNLDRSTRSNSSFIKSLEFLRGTLDSTIDSFSRFELGFSKTFGAKNLKDSIAEIRSFKDNLEFLDKLPEVSAKGQVVNLRAGTGIDIRNAPGYNQAEYDSLKNASAAAALAVETFTEKNKIAEQAMKDLAATMGEEVGTNFISLNKLFKSNNINTFQQETVAAFGAMGKSGEAFITALEQNNVKAFNAALNDTNLSGEDTAKIFNILSDAVLKSGDSFLNAIKVQIGAGKALEDLDGRISNYVNGIDKLKAASVPNKEVVNFILDARNALEGLESTATNVTNNLGEITKKIIDGDDLTVLKQFFDIEAGDDFKKVLGDINSELDVFKGLVDQNARKTNELKVASIELGILKKEEVKTDLRRVSIITDTNKLLLTQAKAATKIAENNVTLLDAELELLVRTKQEKSERAKQIRQDLTVYEATVRARKADEAVIESSTKDLKERLIIEREILANTLAQISAQKTYITINKKLSTSTTKYLATSKQLYKLDKQRLATAVKDLMVRVDQAKLNFEGPALERVLDLEIEKLRVLEAQTRELENQRLSGASREAEVSGEIKIFTKQGVKETAGYFIRELQNGVNGLKSSFEILGKGFANNITDVFDTMVDTLLLGVWGKGGRDFGKAVLESMKEGLRETFGKALKSRIQDAMNGLLENSFIKWFGAEDPSITATNSLTAEITKLINQLINLNRKVENVGDTPGSIPGVDLSGGMDQAIASLPGVTMPSIPEAAKDIIPPIKPAVDSNTSPIGDMEIPDPRPTIIQQNAELMSANASNTQSIVGAINMASNRGIKPEEQEGALASALSSTVLPSSEAGAEAAAEGATETKKGFIGTIQALFQLITAFFSSGGGGEGFMSVIGSFFGAANGGIMPGGMSKPVPLAMGGIATGPNLALIGEGKNNEAVVPLPNNREIPVDLKGDKGGDTITIEQNFDFSNSNADTIATLRTEARAIEDRTFNRVFSEINRGGKYAKMTGRR